jgi:hypothetical protein
MPSKQSRFLVASCMLVSCIAYSSILKMGAICSSETLVNFYRTALLYVPENTTFKIHFLARTCN